MAANTNPIFIATRRTWGLELDNADGTTKLDLVEAGNDGSLIEAIAATSDDTSDVEVDLFITDGSNTWAIGSVTVSAGAGTDGGTTPPVDVLQQTDLLWLRDDLTLALANGYKLQAAAHAAITSGKVVHLVAFGGDY